MKKLKNLALPVVFLILTILFIVQYFTGDSPAYGESIKILLFLVPFLFVLGGSHSPVRRKILLLLPILGVVVLQFQDLMIFVNKWYFSVPWLAHFVVALSLGYSDTDFLANEGRPKSVSLNEADKKDTKFLIPYFSRPTIETKDPSFIGYLLGYTEKGFFGIKHTGS